MRKVLLAVRRFAAETSDRIAVIDAKTSRNWSQLAGDIAALAADMIDLPNVVGLLTPRDHRHIAMDLALASLGKTIVPLPDFFSPRQWGHIIADAGISVVVTVPEYMDRAAETGILIHAARPVPGSGCFFGDMDSKRIIYTSGTTGRPKGVVLSETAMETTLAGLINAAQAVADDVHLSLLPFSLLLEQMAGIFTPLAVGARIHIAASPFEAQAAGATTSIATPDMIQDWTRALRQMGAKAPASLRFVAVGGAPLGAAQAAQAWDVGLPVHEGYGLSECCSVVAVNRPGQRRDGSAGRVLDGVKATIEDGEIVVRGANVMECYLGGTKSGGVWRTGDLGFIDDEGYLTVLGRKDDVAVTAQGRNIHPEWVEPLILADPAVKACAVIAGSHGLAAVIVAADAAASTDPLVWLPRLRALTAALPDYAKPAEVLVLSRDQAASANLFTLDNRPRRRLAAQFLKETKMSFYDRLLAETAAERNDFTAMPLIAEAARNGVDRQLYLSFLNSAYHHVRYTVPLLKAAAAACGPADAVLAAGYEDYVAEETGHEEWILDDIAALGGDAQAARHGRPPLAVRVLVAHAFHLISEDGPLSLLGMVHVLEGMSVALAIKAAQAVKARLGHDGPGGFSYLTSHGDLDVGHVDAFAKLLEAVDTPAARQIVVTAAKEFYVLYGNVFRALTDQPRGADHAA